jgi:putative membrane protein
MNVVAKILLTAVLVLLISHFLPGVAVADFITSIVVAMVLAVLNVFVKPILILLTLPVTLLTFGLFLLIINAILIVLCARIVDGFAVHSFFTAFLFSIILSFFQSVLFSVKRDK